MIEGENGLNNILIQMEAFAKDAWTAHPDSQPATATGKKTACLFVENLVTLLSSRSGFAPQILDSVYMDRQEYQSSRGVKVSRVGVLILREAVGWFIPTGDVDYISFETHPEWAGIKRAADLRWLIIRGSFVDDGERNLWEREYVFDGSEIKKQEKIFYDGRWRNTNNQAAVDLADLNTITGVVLGIRDQVGSLLVR